MSLSIPSISSEWISTLVVADDDPTGLTVRFAFTDHDPETDTTAEPITEDWKTGEWDGTARVMPDGRYQARARIKIGPGTAVVLENGDYGAWVRAVEADPNGPTRLFDTLTIT